VRALETIGSPARTRYNTRVMAALAPLSGASHAGGIAPPTGTPLPLPGTGGPVAPARGASFAAFPSSYRSFGNDQAGYGTVGVKNGSLTVIPATGSAGGSGTTAGASPSAAVPPSAAPPDPSGDPKPGDLPSAIPPPPPIPIASLPPQPIPQTPGLNAPSLGEGEQPLPGPFANAESGQNQGPDPVAQQQADQEAAAQQAQAQQAAAQAVRDEQLTTALQNVSFRLSAAYGEGNQSAANQLTPVAVQINGELQNQPFAGVGTTPPQPFATPEVPNVFFNIPA
jgi:hypothetical protein